MREFDLQRKIIAVIPAYHDVDKLLKVLSKFTANLVDEVCLVIDCLNEKESEKISRVTSNLNMPFHVITNNEREGIGYALKQGIKYGIDSHYDIVVIMAGNDKDDPREIPKLVDPIINDGFDYVQGSRFLPGGKKVRNPFFRGVFSRVYPFVWTILTKTSCTDVTNGFRAYNLAILTDSKINIWQDWLDSYQLEYYIHYKVLTLGYKMREVPVSKTYSHRNKGGYSKISPLKDWWTIIGPLIYLRLGVRK
jgi:dolichol-phosphate mannosyltransferase